MGRKDKFTVDYFLHKCNHGKTIYILENRFGNDGYAVWFKTLELLGATENHFYDCRNITDMEFLTAKMHVEPDKLQQIYNLLANLKTIDQELWTNKVIWSENFVNGLSEVYSRRSNNCMNKNDLFKHLLIKCKQKSKKTKVSGVSGNKKTTTVLNSTVLNSIIYNHWNAKKIIVHQKQTDETKRKIATKLKDYSEQEIKTAIDNYAIIINDSQYYFTYKWTLVDFLKKGLDKFMDLDIAKSNYKSNAIEPKERKHDVPNDEYRNE